MNKNQQKVSIVTAILIALMTLYPPFGNDAAQGIVRGAGYDWIFTDTRATVIVEVLLIQIFVTLFVGGVLYFVLDKRNNK